MINNKIYQLYKKLIITFGKEAQIIIAIEELEELQKELTEWMRGKGHICNIAEEIANVQIMLEVPKVMFACDKEVESIVLSKLQRAETLLEVENDKRNE